MFHEYALEPAVLSSWERTRFFLDAFGPWKGRFLAEFPRKWKNLDLYTEFAGICRQRAVFAQQKSQPPVRVQFPQTLHKSGQACLSSTHLTGSVQVQNVHK